MKCCYKQLRHCYCGRCTEKFENGEKRTRLTDEVKCKVRRGLVEPMHRNKTIITYLLIYLHQYVTHATNLPMIDTKIKWWSYISNHIYLQQISIHNTKLTDKLSSKILILKLWHHERNRWLTHGKNTKKFVCKGPIDNTSVLVLVVAWRQASA